MGILGDSKGVQRILWDSIRFCRILKIPRDSLRIRLGFSGFLQKVYEVFEEFNPSGRKRYPFCATSEGLDTSETLHTFWRNPDNPHKSPSVLAEFPWSWLLKIFKNPLKFLENPTGIRRILRIFRISSRSLLETSCIIFKVFQKGAATSTRAVRCSVRWTVCISGKHIRMSHAEIPWLSHD